MQLTSLLRTIGHRTRERFFDFATRPLVTVLRFVCRNQIPILTREELLQSRITLSQFGEDVILAFLAKSGGIKYGVYVDVGAFDPISGSNTLLLYKAGWRGVNIDLQPERIARFNRLRPSDDNICAAISDRKGNSKVAFYSDPGTTRLIVNSENHERSVSGEPPSRIETIQTLTLTEALDQTRLRSSRIDYLNIDCEGHDLAVLQSLDFARYEPSIISVEAISTEAEERITQFLKALTYSRFLRQGLTVFYLREGFLG
jgi:FkbM family methyltransferase